MLRLYLPCDQVLEAAQLVLVLWVLSAVLFSEEGLWGTGRDLRLLVSQVGHMIHFSGIETKLDVKVSRSQALVWNSL